MTKLGIDLGAAVSRVACIDARGFPSLVPDRRSTNRLETPTAVLVHEGLALVGQAAEDILPSEAGLPVARGFKEKLGRAEPALIDAEGRSWPAAATAALVLRKLLGDAQAQRPGSPVVEGGVLAVPATFELDQRRALCQAARLAGLSVLGMVDEPIAIAIHYAVHQNPDGGNLLILDLGKSGARATALRAEADGPRILGCGNASSLAGDRFDEAFADLLADTFQHVHGLDPREDPATLATLRRDGERLKIALAQSDAPSVRTMILAADRILETIVTRRQFDKVTASLLDQARLLCERTLHGAGLDWKDLDLILLAGGSANLPAIVPAVIRWSGLPSDRILVQRPELAVAFGAARVAAGLAESAVGRARKVAEADLGFLVIDPATNSPAVDVIIRRGTPIPVRRGSVYYSSRADQRRMFFEVVQVPDPSAPSIPLGRFAFPLDPPGKDRRLEVTLGYDVLGFPFVEALDPDTGHAVRRELSEGVDPEEGAGRIAASITFLS